MEMTEEPDKELMMNSLLEMLFNYGASGMNWTPDQGVKMVGNLNYTSNEGGIEKSTVTIMHPSNISVQ